jgi:predicted Zn-dependent protease
MKVCKIYLSGAFCLAFLTATCVAQPAGNTAPCPAAPAILTPAGTNIFNEQQEQYLGDAIAEYLEPDLRIIPHSGENDYLAAIGQKLLALLPPSSIHFQFRLYDSGELNAFSVAGGRVYISRRLVSAAQNEDDIAGVIAHELGPVNTIRTTATGADFSGF